MKHFKPSIILAVFLLLINCVLVSPPAFGKEAASNLYYSEMSKAQDTSPTKDEQIETFTDYFQPNLKNSSETIIKSPLDKNWSFIMGMGMQFDELLDGDGLEKAWAGFQMQW